MDHRFSHAHLYSPRGYGEVGRQPLQLQSDGCGAWFGGSRCGTGSLMTGCGLDNAYSLRSRSIEPVSPLPNTSGVGGMTRTGERRQVIRSPARSRALGGPRENCSRNRGSSHLTLAAHHSRPRASCSRCGVSIIRMRESVVRYVRSQWMSPWVPSRQHA